MEENAPWKPRVIFQIRYRPDIMQGRFQTVLLNVRLLSPSSFWQANHNSPQYMAEYCSQPVRVAGL